MNILFLCNGNVARSQEAEVFFNAVTKKNYALSAGVNVKIGKPLDPLVVEVMREQGFTLEGNFRKLVDKELVTSADLIISFKPKNELPEAVRSHANVGYWSIPDPQHQSIEFHRQVRDAVKANVNELFEQIG